MPAEIRVTSGGRRQILTHRHPWLFRPNVASGEATPGALVRVVDSNGRQLGWAAWSPESQIALRFLTIDSEAPCPTAEDLAGSFRAAVHRRADLAEQTDAVRLVSSEADGFPGLIIDRYAHAVVVQALTPFADQLLPEVAGWLQELPGVESVLARNDASVRKLEGLPQEVRLLYGPEPGEVEIREGEIRLLADLRHGQKTGLFLDQRSNRIRFGAEVAEGARVLDLFCHVGGFGMHAARRAASVLAVEDSARTQELASRNAALNGLDNVTVVRNNAFPFLRQLAGEGEQFDAVVLDPPAFAKNRRQQDDALRGYLEVNLRALKLIRPGGLLVTASCSYHVDEPTFEEVVRSAAADAGRDATVLGRTGQDRDHPVLLSLPQSRYLKCLFLRIH